MPNAAGNPRVSVVITTYNRAAMLPRAIRSVLAQTYEDYELIIVDDCSADDTPEVTRTFVDPRIRIVRHPDNRGHPAAVNTGIRLAPRRVRRLPGRRRRMAPSEARAPVGNARRRSTSGSSLYMVRPRRWS